MYISVEILQAAEKILSEVGIDSLILDVNMKPKNYAYMKN